MSDSPGSSSSSVPVWRVGQGFDVHKWSSDPERRLVLGGVRFDDSPGLVGHSDADVVSHACIDALLGACGLGDIGQMFPDNDPALAGADSLELLRHAMALITGEGWTVANVDCTVVLDAPKLAPHRSEMESLLTDIVNAPVTVKGKRTEGVTALGEGVQCFAVAGVMRTV